MSKRHPTSFEQAAEHFSGELTPAEVIADRHETVRKAGVKSRRNKDFRKKRVQRNVQTAVRGVKKGVATSLVIGAAAGAVEIAEYAIDHIDAGQPNTERIQASMEAQETQDHAVAIDRELQEGEEVSLEQAE